jgi:hypothetical protein
VVEKANQDATAVKDWTASLHCWRVLLERKAHEEGLTAQRDEEDGGD